MGGRRWSEAEPEGSHGGGPVSGAGVQLILQEAAKGNF